MFVNKLFAYVTYTYLKYQRCFNVKSATCYVHIKKVLLIFKSALVYHEISANDYL